MHNHSRINNASGFPLYFVLSQRQSLSNSISFSSISSHNNIMFASLAQQTHTHNRRTRQRRTIESQSNSAAPPFSFFYSNPTSIPHPIQLNSASSISLPLCSKFPPFIESKISVHLILIL